MKTLLRYSVFSILILYGSISQAQQPPYIIPVVFHILHTGGNTNISDAQILDAVRILNEDYNLANPDLSFVINTFAGIVGDMQITFRLANLDPNGQCTNGIERIYSNQTFQGQNQSSKINQWPPDKYLNIWIYDKMQGGFGGFAYPPFAQNFNPQFDGIVLLNDYIGSIGTGNLNTSRALTKETGNYLGLLTMGIGFNCIDEDSVGDTPPAVDISFCDLAMQICNGVDTANVQNFMTYSYCSNMFTQGQCTRVHNILNTYTTRSNLPKPANLAATGTGSAVSTPCAPIADFYVSKPYACIGDSIKFVDASYNGKVTGRQWQFTNADISTSSDSAVFVRFNTTGWQSVTLSVTNAQGSNTITKQLVFVRSLQNLSAPYYTGFDDANDFDANWAVVNKDNDLPRFQYFTSAGHTNNTSVRLNNNRSSVTGNIDELYTPPFDCSQLTNTNAKVNFWYSYATAGYREPKDSLVLYASKNCGSSWTRLFTIPGEYLINAGVVPTSFVPDNDVYWTRVSANIPGPSSNINLRTADVSFKIQVFGADSSNNLYIDDFSIGGATVGVEEVNELSGVSLTPNPFMTTLAMHNIAEGAYTVDVSNAHGQIILHQSKLDVSQAGNMQLNMEGHPSGVYFITLKGDGSTITLKAVKQ